MTGKEAPNKRNMSSDVSDNKLTITKIAGHESDLLFCAYF